MTLGLRLSWYEGKGLGPDERETESGVGGRGVKEALWHFLTSVVVGGQEGGGGGDAPPDMFLKYDP